MAHMFLKYFNTDSLEWEKQISNFADTGDGFTEISSLDCKMVNRNLTSEKEAMT